MRRMLKYVVDPFLKWRHARRSSSIQYWNSPVGRMEIHPGVFHPGQFGSSRFLLEYVLSQPTANLKLAEMGAGSGYISLGLKQQNQHITAFEISEKAIRNMRCNMQQLGLDVPVVQSDLFASCTPEHVFDIWLVNPPYFPKQPENIDEMAWYCGVGHAYFVRFFEHVASHLSENGKIWMVLSSTCDVKQIEGQARLKGFRSRVVAERKFLFETQMILEFY